MSDSEVKIIVSNASPDSSLPLDWVNKEDMLKMLTHPEFPTWNMCTYCPPRGIHKDKFCCAYCPTVNASNTCTPLFYRCMSHVDKIGRGETVLGIPRLETCFFSEGRTCTFHIKMKADSAAKAKAEAAAEAEIMKQHETNTNTSVRHSSTQSSEGTSSWLDIATYLFSMASSMENPLCSYSPMNGEHVGKFCGNPATRSMGVISQFRCGKHLCYGGEGSKLLVRTLFDNYLHCMRGDHNSCTRAPLGQTKVQSHIEPQSQFQLHSNDSISSLLGEEWKIMYYEGSSILIRSLLRIKNEKKEKYFAAYGYFPYHVNTFNSPTKEDISNMLHLQPVMEKYLTSLDIFISSVTYAHMCLPRGDTPQEERTFSLLKTKTSFACWEVAGI